MPSLLVAYAMYLTELIVGYVKFRGIEKAQEVWEGQVTGSIRFIPVFSLPSLRYSIIVTDAMSVPETVPVTMKLPGPVFIGSVDIVNEG